MRFPEMSKEPERRHRSIKVTNLKKSIAPFRLHTAAH
jgi:hypothetical protein